MHEESGFRGSEYSEARLRDFAQTVLNNPMMFCAVDDRDGEIVGFFLGMLSPMWWGSDFMASDLILYVAPDKRGAASGVRLVKAFEEWARRQGVKEVRLGVSTEIAPERTAALYERLGFRQIGTIHKKVL
jgi:GNAT superfamily N-acetyltransferase